MVWRIRYIFVCSWTPRTSIPFSIPSLPEALPPHHSPFRPLSPTPPPSLSSVLFFPPVFFLLQIVITEPRLGYYLHKTIRKEARVTFLYGPGSKPVTNRGDLRENKLLACYGNFTADTTNLHGGTKQGRDEADEFQSQTTTMERQLQIRFEMDIPVLRGFTVTNGFVPTWNTNLLCFHRSEED